MKTLGELRTYFKKSTRINGNSFQCCCPCHNDKMPSLTISERNGKILIHCHAGCETDDIIKSVGLDWADINPTKITAANDKPKEPMFEAVYDYESPNGDYLYSKTRSRDAAGNKVIRHAIIKDGNIISHKKPQNMPLTLYNISALQRAISEGYPVFYCEGEKDVDTLKKYNFTATTAGSVSDWKKEHAKFFKGADLIILIDNDKAGEELANRMARDLKYYCHKIRIIKTSENEHGDVTDYLDEGHTIKDVMALIKEANVEYAPWVYLTKAGKPCINADILAKSIVRNSTYIKLTNTHGQGIATYEYFNGVYIPVSTDSLNAEIRKYVPTGILEAKTMRDVASLIPTHIKSVAAEEINASEQYINLKNGLFNMETWELEEHNPKILSTFQLNCNYKPAANSLKWERFINDFCRDSDGNVKQDMKQKLQEWFGILLTPIHGSRIKKALILYSPIGNTGKSLFTNILGHIIGARNIANIPFQEMGTSRWVGYRAFGKRLILVGDQDGESIKSSSMFKQFTGGDIIKAEAKGKDAFDFIYTGFIVIACNKLPTFEDDKGEHMLQRFSLMHCENSIPEEKRIANLDTQLLQELDGVIAWAMIGLKRLLSNNLRFTRCESSETLENDYRMRIDTVHNFMEHCCIKTKDKKDMVKRADFNTKYEHFCIKNDLTQMKKNNIQQRLESYGIKAEKYNGIFMYRGIKFK